MKRGHEIAAAAGLVGTLVAVFLIYSVGLTGPFLFDDFTNLDRLGEYGGVEDLKSAISYVFSANTSPGRPLAYASFLLDDFTWPSDPYRFKYNNVLLHLLAGLAVYAFAFQLGRLRWGDRAGRAAAVGVLAMALWLLHPLFVSTVLYIVQRMTILSAVFVLAGLALYISGRRALAAGRAGRGFTRMTVAAGVLMPLGILSKENAALFPVLILVLEITVLRASPVAAGLRRWNRRWQVLFVYIPLAGLVGYFALAWDPMIVTMYMKRDFTLEERLLTEARIVIQYLVLLLIPRIQTAGLYNDNIEISTDLLTPATTLPSVLAILAAVVLAVAGRKRAPWLSFGILFFFAAHILESTFMPIELYFEHRNYLPAVSLFVLAAVGLVTLAKTNLRLGMVATALIVLTYGATLYARASLWSSFPELTLMWAEENPTSLRVHQQAAILWSAYGRRDLALEHLEQAIRHNPDSPPAQVQYLGVACASGDLGPGDLEKAENTLENHRYTSYVFDSLERLIESKQAGTCRGLSWRDIEGLVDATLRNSGIVHLVTIQRDLNYLKGYIRLSQGELPQAVEAFEHAMRLDPRPDVGMQITGLLAGDGHHSEALGFLEMAEEAYHRQRASGYPYKERLKQALIDYPAEFVRIRRQLEAAAATQTTE